MGNEAREDRTIIVEKVRELSAQGNALVALVTIHLTYPHSEKNTPAKRLLAEQARESSTYLLQHLRSLVRKTDHVLLQEHALYFILLGANVQGACIVEERLWEALLWRTHNMSEHEQHMLHPLSMTIGHAAFPDPQDSPDALLQAADVVSRRYDEQAGRSVAHSVASTPPEVSEELPQLARKLGIPYLSLLPGQVPPRVQQVVDAKLAHELHCYPVGRVRNTLTVAMRDPQDRRALERLHQETGLRIFPVLAHPEALENALKQLL